MIKNKGIKKENIKENKILNILFLMALFIISFIFVTNIITTLGWLVKIPITSFHLIIGFILNILVVYFLQKKKFAFEKKDYLKVVIGSLLVVIISFIVAILFMDISYDGSWYHLTSIIRMKDGWNPIYEHINSGYYGDVFIDSYANKAVWSFSACCYKLFGMMNSSKMFSTLLAFSTCLLSISVFLRLVKDNKKITKLAVILISMLIAFNPIYVEQMFTNYIDSSLGLLVISYIVLFMAYYLEQFSFKDLIYKYYIVILIAIMANVKLTGLFFAGVFFFIFLGLPMFKSLKNKGLKEFKRIFFTGFIGVALVLFIGINPYITNVLRGHNMFYPIIGKEKIEVMGENVPDYIRNKTILEKIAVVNFSETVNSPNAEEMKLLNPFSLNINSYKNMGVDTRVGAFGPLTMLAMLFIFGLLFRYFKYLINKKENKLLLLSILAVIVIAIIFPESWWGRYYPELFLIPCFFTLYLVLSNKKALRVSGYIIICILVLNIGLIFGKSFYYNYIVKCSMDTALIGVNKSDIVYEAKYPNFTCETDAFDYVFMNYFKEKGVNATSVCKLDNKDYDWNYDLVNVKIRKIN